MLGILRRLNPFMSKPTLSEKTFVAWGNRMKSGFGEEFYETERFRLAQMLRDAHAALEDAVYDSSKAGVTRAAVGLANTAMAVACQLGDFLD
jgi:hypothetical protein